MHEAGIIQEVLRTAEQHARSAGGTVIRRIVLRVGVFSSAVPEALEFAFHALRLGTLAASAELEIEREPATSYCPDCQREFPVGDPIFECPVCGSIGSELRRGFALVLVRVEVETGG